MSQSSSAPFQAVRARRLIAFPAWGLALVLLVLLFGLHIAFGAKDLPLSTVFKALIQPDDSLFEHMIVRDLRLPRALAAMLVGAALSVTGALMQGVTRNPLADPHLLGLMSGASFVVVMASFFFGAVPPALLPPLAAGGALLAALAVLMIARWVPGGATPLTLTLSGAALTVFLEALISLIHLFTTISFEDLRVWLSGSLAGQSMELLAFTAPWILLGLMISFAMAGAVTAMAMGEEVAKGLGIGTRRARALLLATVVIMTAASVALAGPLGFVGLLVPHVVRLFVGADYRRIIPWSAMGGAVYLLAVDIVARVAIAPQEISTGIITAIIGAPVFVHLVRKRGR